MKRGFFPELDGKIEKLRSRPFGGWIHTARKALGLSLVRLGKLSGVTPQAVKDAERRELDGTISLRRLREIAAAMDMQLVYGFIPRGGSVAELERERALEVAKKVYQRTYQTMLLEDQLPEDMETRRAEEVEEIAGIIIRENPAALWN